MKNNMLNTVNPEADVVRARRERTNYRQGQAGQLAGSLGKKLSNPDVVESKG